MLVKWYRGLDLRKSNTICILVRLLTAMMTLRVPYRILFNGIIGTSVSAGPFTPARPALSQWPMEAGHRLGSWLVYCLPNGYQDIDVSNLLLCKDGTNSSCDMLELKAIKTKGWLANCPVIFTEYWQERIKRERCCCLSLHQAEAGGPIRASAQIKKMKG